jgi:hypothetical protein
VYCVYVKRAGVTRRRVGCPELAYRHHWAHV